MKLGKSLKIALVNNNMRQKELAEILGVRSHTVSYWARKGMIPRDSLQAICDVLGLKVSEFIALGE